MDDGMKNIEAWQGDTIPLTATKPDDTAESVTLLIGEVGEPAIFAKTAEYDEDGNADLTITDEENIEANIPAGEHGYMLNVTYEGGAEISFPRIDNCEDDASIPKFIIRQRIGNETS